MHFPEQTYRWLVSLRIIPNQGEITEKNTVTIHQHLSAFFQSGYNISQIVKSILVRGGQKPPSCLDNVRKELNKNVKLTNWNFIWLSFDDLRMQFDARIKDLILQGQNALIVQIVKQLADRDQNKNEQVMRNIVITGKQQNQKMDKTQKQPGKHSTSLDIKKINVQKDPNQSQSSLEFLILLLSSSLNMNVEEILGLFTNQNKYLAHIIVKGINEDYSGVTLFYTLLNKYDKKLKEFIEDDQKDAESCLYAIKPGFISKNETVALLTLEIFSKLGNVYHWLISETTRGSTTLLLGVKRHPHLAEKYFNLLSDIISNNDIQFFTNHFKVSFKDPREMVEICKYLLMPIGDCYLKGKMLDVGIFTQWLDIAVNMFNNSPNLPQQSVIEDKQLVIDFIGEMMLFVPEAINQNEDCLQILRRGWKQRTWIQYILMIDEMFNVLRKLAQNKSPFASRMYQIIIDIFQDVSDFPTKKQYLVLNFTPIVEDFPGMPSHYFIQTYENTNYLDAQDNQLVQIALSGSKSVEGLVQIGEVLLKMFANGAVVNGYLGPKIHSTAKKVGNQEIGQALIKKAVKDCLNAFTAIQIHKKNPQVAKPQPMYFNHKGNSDKVSQEEVEAYKIKEKQSQNLLTLVDKLCELSKTLRNEHLQTQLREQLLDANAYIRKHNFKVSGKGITNILRKFNVSKQDEADYDEQYRNKKSIVSMQESLVKKKNVINNLSQLAASRVGGPEHLRKQFSEVVERRKRQEEQKRIAEQKRQKQEELKKISTKKQIQKLQLLRGFGSGETQLKEEGFWSRFIKEQNKQIQLYHPDLMQQRDLNYIENLFKRFHRVLRHLFLKYTSSMYSIKSVNNFQDNQARKEVINTVEIIKFLKDYKLFFLTSNPEIQNLVRDINVKLLNKRENQQLDFLGFQQFIIQFGAVIFTKPHTVNTKSSKGAQNTKKNMSHVTHCQLVEQIFNYLRLVFIEKGEKTTLFDEPETAYFSESEVIKQFNKKLQQDPGFILPEGYKKVIDKTYKFVPQLSEKVNKNINSNYIDVLDILDTIVYESTLGFHLIEPITEKITKARVKPHAFTNNIKPKLMTDTLGESKTRAMSSIVERKSLNIHPPVKMMERKVLSFGMKLGLSYVGYKDKLLGEQVAFVIDDMITAVENNRTTIQKQKVVNEVIKKRQQMSQMERKLQSDREKKRKQRKQQLQKIKKQMAEKKQKQLQQTKQERQKKKQKQLSAQKKKKQDIQKFLNDQKLKRQENKKKEEEQKKKLRQEKKKKREQDKKNREKFNQFNEKQIEKLKKGFDQTVEQKKKSEEQMREEQKHKEDLYKKLRSKISAQDKKIIELRHKNNEEISELQNSAEITQVFTKFQPNLKALFNFLIRNTFTSLTERKHNNEIIAETWHYFGLAFQLNPLIIESKQMQNIFRSLTKDKQVRKQYYLGLNFEEFQQALLRIAIKHKTVFNKIAEKIKQNDMSEKQIDAVIEKDIEQKQKNQFDQPKEIDVKSLLIQEDINKEIIDDYGDISKVTPITLKGLIYYLKVPNQKYGQQKRFRDVIARDNSYVQKYSKLREKLKQDYSLTSPRKKQSAKKMQKSSQSIKKDD